MSVPQVTDGGTSSLRCECGDRACRCTIRLIPRSTSPCGRTRRTLPPTTRTPRARLIEEHKRFAVVETVSGEAANSPVEATRANGVGREIRPETSK